MKEHEMRARVERLLDNALRGAAPAAVGLTLALTACESADDSTVPVYSALMVDSGTGGAGGAGVGGAGGVGIGGAGMGGGAVALYMAQMPDSGPAVRYMAQMPDSG